MLEEQGTGGIWLGRARKACELCRRRKIRCEWDNGQICLACQNAKTKCLVPEGQRKVKNVKKMQNNEVLSLTKRLNEMEARLKALTASTTEPATPRPLLPTGDMEPLEEIAPGRTQQIQPRRPIFTQNLSATSFEPLLSSKVPKWTESLGRQSSLSWSAPTYHNSDTWSTHKYHHESFKYIAESAVLNDALWKPEVFTNIFQPSVHKFTPLPIETEALLIVDEYFNGLNQAISLYSREAFMSLFQAHDDNKAQRESSGWWASLNIVLALGHRIRSMRTLNSKEEDPKAWGYLQNAIHVLPELTLRNKDLLSVQALLGIAIFLQGTSTPYAASSLIATAISQLQTLDLHRESSDFSETGEQRRRVFWLAYILDKDISLRTGRPSVQNDSDMDVSMPNSDPPNNSGVLMLSSGSSAINIFNLRIKLSLIQSTIYQDLYSVQGSKRSDVEKLILIAKLDTELQQWKASIPWEFWPENIHEGLPGNAMLHMGVLYCNFFNTIALVHSQAPGYNLNIRNLVSHLAASRPLLDSEEKSLSASRSILKIMRLFPRGDYAVIWLNLYFSFAAYITLATNLYLRPLHGTLNDDWELITEVHGQFQLLASDVDNKGAASMFACSSNLLCMAKDSMIESNLMGATGHIETA